MKRASAILVVCLALPLGAQDAAARFEVASIKPVAPSNPSGSGGIYTGHGRLSAKNVTLKRCIMGAYGVGPNLIFAGPPWMDTDLFDIEARSDLASDGDAELDVKLRTLLAERFHLVVRRETRNMPVLLLEMAKAGPKLEKAGNAESSTTSSRGRIEAKNTSLDRFAEVLSRAMDLPVVNRTALDGGFNLKLEWTPESAKAAADAGPSVFTAIQEQLGLRLRSGKAPLEVLVIDHAEKPSEN